jgi:hypothetical protein
MRRLLSIFFAFALLLTTAVGEASSLSPSCPPKACCCGSEDSCCPPPVAPLAGNCGQDQAPSQSNCGRTQAPIQVAQLPQVPDEVEAAKTAGDPYAHPWPAALEQSIARLTEGNEPRFLLDFDGALERAPDRLAKLRILRI